MKNVTVTHTLGALLVAAVATTTPLRAQGSIGFARTGSMTAARSWHTATLLPDGTVLVAGGERFSGYLGTGLATTELYDPSTGTFAAGASMRIARFGHTATLLADGRVLVAGGYQAQGIPAASAEIYDPSTKSFSPTGSMITGRVGHDAILLSNGTVLFLGGWAGPSYPPPPSAEIYDPATGHFSAAGPYAGYGGCDFCAPSVLLADGQVLYAGEYPAQLYDPLSDSFRRSGQSLDDESAAALLLDGRVLFAGGEPLGRSNFAELYDPVTETFAATGAMGLRRVWHTLTLLPDGTALAAGGETDSCSSSGYCYFAGTVANAEVYDPSVGAFVTGVPMVTARELHTATLLNDGRVLIAGGEGYGGIGVFYGAGSTAELYVPSTVVPPPTLLGAPADTTGQGAIAHASSGALVSSDNPAAAFETLAIACTGLASGAVIPPQVTIGGRLAQVLSFAASADSSGSYQILVNVPDGVAGPAVAVQMRYLGRITNQVTIAVRGDSSAAFPKS